MIIHTKTPAQASESLPPVSASISSLLSTQSPQQSQQQLQQQQYASTTTIRKSRRRNRRGGFLFCCSYENTLWFFLLGLVVLFTFVNVFMSHHGNDIGSTNVSSSELKSIPVENKNSGGVGSVGKSLGKHKEQDETDNDDKGPLLDILKMANISLESGTLTEEQLQSLPTWQQVVSRFGSKPRIVGLETCETYRNQVPLSERHVAPSGMFSTGTNLLHQLMSWNCMLPPKTPQQLKQNPKHKRNTGVDWQVNWGKHQSPRFRLTNHVWDNIDNSKVFPVVLVRDPYTWFQSMCKVRYSAHWYHVVPHHCPNFIPNHVEYEWYNKTREELQLYYNRDPWKVDNVWDKANFSISSSKVIPIRVRYKSEIAFHESLAHFWKDWNEEYYYYSTTTAKREMNNNHNATTAATTNTTISSPTISSIEKFPRLMIRLEDLVFHPQEILQTICDCVGGSLYHPLRYQGETSKQGTDNIHGMDKTDLIKAMTMHIFTNRTKGMTLDDIDFAKSTLGASELLNTFGYSHPNE